jgi:formylglycine-generating enzyme required for sulfatase activity/MinD-like ATPase involved in chromosome partitioning or flagellar assembly
MVHPTDNPDRAGKIVTFYSYKGGTGRSMALANVAWILASSGCRVLTIDWDLEAPGLHRYFHPFLVDKNLSTSPGIIDFMVDFVSAALTQPVQAKSHKTADQTANAQSNHAWFYPQADLLRYGVSLRWEKFSKPGTLDFVPAGRQDLGYPIRVNSFSWKNFYENLGGGVFLEAAKNLVRREYDYILIDSRTGVSDTSGICTIQMPDELVVCFTLNSQSIDGAAAAAKSALDQRTTPQGKPSIKVWPVPMRVEPSEKERLERARTLARTKFNSFLSHLSPDQRDRYWGEIEVNYEPYYAYEEVLATFGDRPRQKNSILSKMEVITNYITEGRVKEFKPIQETERRDVLSRFIDRPALSSADDFLGLAHEYEQLRERMAPGGERTFQMNALVDRIQTLAGTSPTPNLPQELFRLQTSGARITGLAIAQRTVQPKHIDLAVEAISDPRSAFEQFHALILADRLLQAIDTDGKERIRQAIKSQIGKFITPGDPSRWQLAESLLNKLRSEAKVSTGPQTGRIAGGRIRHEEFVVTLQDHYLPMIEISVDGARVRYRDPIQEQYGPFLLAKGAHELTLPRGYRIATQLVTNQLFMEFVTDKGYANHKLWEGPTREFLTSEADGLGPSLWTSDSKYPKSKEAHPVTGVSYIEARAFCAWLQLKYPPSQPNWRWSLPTEDAWELAARSVEGLSYPWGSTFESGRCNSAESGFGDTTKVGEFPLGVSPYGCYDMAGNVWEFILADDQQSGECVLRGGSFKNNQFEIRSYLRLENVPTNHRPLDFGFRCAQIDTSDEGRADRRTM